METYTKWIAEQYVITGEKYQQKLKFDEAIKLYTDAITISRDNPEYYGQRALCKLSIFDYASALSDARRSTELDGKYKNGYILRAKCCIALGEVSAAEEAIDNFLDKFPSQDIIEEQNQLGRLKRLLMDYKRSFNTNNFDECLSLLEEAIKLSPGSIHLQLNRAKCMLWKKCFTEAENITLKIIQSDDANAEAHFVLGTIYYHKDMLQDALRCFEVCLQLSAEHVEAKEMTALLKSIITEDEKASQYISKKKFDAALVIYQRLLQLDLKKNPIMMSKIYFNCALMNFNQNDFLESMRDSCKALDRNPSYYNALVNRAQCYFNLSNLNDAIADCLAAYEIQQTEEVKSLFLAAINEAGVKLRKEKKKNAETYIIIGNRFHREKNYTEAINKYTQAIQHSPESSEFYEYRIASYMMTGELKQALKDFARIALLGDLNDNQLITKAKCLILKGDISEAQNILHEIDTDSTSCEYDLDMLNDMIHKITQLNENMEKQNYEASSILLDIIAEDYNQLMSNDFRQMRAECLSSQGRLDEALKILNDITPATSDVLYLKGSVLYQQNQLDESIVQLERCLESDSSNEKALHLLVTIKYVKHKLDLGIKMLKLDHNEEANCVFEEIENTLNGSNKKLSVDLAFKRATCFFKLSKYGECIKYCNLVAGGGEDVKNDVYSLCELAKKKLTDPIPRNKMNKRNSDRDFQLGLEFYEMEDYEAAIGKFTDAIDGCSKVAEYYFRRAECYLKISDHASALPDAKSCISLDKNSVEGYLIAAKCHIVLGDIIEVRAVINNLEEINSRTPVDDLNEILGEYKKWEKSIQNAIRCFDNKDYKLCIEYINDVIEITPNPLKFQMIKAECFVLLGEYYKAQILYESIGDIKDYKYINGLIYYYENNFDKALKNLRKYMEYDDININAKRIVSFIEAIEIRRKEGNILMEKEFHESALSVFMEALTIDNTCLKANSELHLKCALCNWKLGYREECIEDCKAALKLVPRYAEAESVRDECQKEIDKIAYERKIANDATIQNQIGDEHKTNGNYEKAIGYYSRAIEIMPKVPSYYANRAICGLMIGDYETTLHDAREVIVLDETFIDAYIWEAKCLILLGDTESDVNVTSRLQQLDLFYLLRSEQKKEIAELQKIRYSFISATGSFKTGNFDSCIKYIDKAFEKSSHSNYYKQMRAECLIRLYRSNEASENIMQITPNESVEVLRLKCLLYYYEDNFEDVIDLSTTCVNLFKDAEIKRIIMISKKILNLINQDHSLLDNLLPNNKENDKNILKLLNAEITKYIIKGNSSDIRMKLYYQRALVNYRLCRVDDAFRDCADALAINAKYVNVLRTRAKWFYEAKRFGECTRDCKTLFAIEKTNVMRQLSGGPENMNFASPSPRGKSMSPNKSLEY